MRRMFAAALAALALVGAGCGRDNDGEQEPSIRASTVVVPETRVDAVPHEEPAVARASWRAVGDTARAVTGNLRVSIERTRGGPLIFAFASGITVRAQPFSVTPADTRSGVGGQSFARCWAGIRAWMSISYRVLNENATTPRRGKGLRRHAHAHHGGKRICRRQRPLGVQDRLVPRRRPNRRGRRYRALQRLRLHRAIT